MKRFFAMTAAAAMFAIGLVGCGSSKDDFVGKWEAKSMTVDGETMEGEYMGIDIGAMFQVEFKDDDSGYIKIYGEDNVDFDWKAEDDSVDVTVDGETVTFEKDGDYIKAEEGEGDEKTSFTLKKVDEFSELDLSKLDVGGSDSE